MLNGHLGVAVLDLLSDPDLKRVADDAVDQVDQPLFWDFSNLPIIGKVIEHFAVVATEV